MSYRHEPVMLPEVLALLQPQSGETFLDGTLGGAGYALALAKAVGPTGRVIALDLDELALKHARTLIKKNKISNIKLIQGNFAEIQNLIPKSVKKINGMVLDLGLSSAQLDDPRRGFSFRAQGPLDMTFAGDGQESKTAVIVNGWSEGALAQALKDYGEERYATRIARSIVSARPLKTIPELVAAISRAVPGAYKKQSIHFATRSFQALRIASNDELNNLQKFLPAALSCLAPGGRLAIVSFHSLEDRLVKQFFAHEAKACLCPPQLPICVCGHKPSLKILTKKALVPGATEISANPRARSAKLRAIIKL